MNEQPGTPSDESEVHIRMQRTHTNPRRLLTHRCQHPQTSTDLPVPGQQSSRDTSPQPCYLHCSFHKESSSRPCAMPQRHTQTRGHGHTRDMSTGHSDVRPVAFGNGSQRPTPQVPRHTHTGCDISPIQKHRKSWSVSPWG